MSWLLKGLSQDMNLAEKDQVKYYLAFQKEDGAEVRLPIPVETATELIKLSHSDKIKAPPNPPRHTLAGDPSTDPEGEDAVPDGATEFGGEDPSPEDDNEIQEYPNETPDSEDEVESL